MPRFGVSSRKRLETCDERLQKIFNEVIKHVDCSVLCGHRGKDEQNKAYKEGKSKAKYPKGRHNRKPSLAVDVSPYPIDWKDLERQTLFAGFVLGVAKQMGINLIWGNDWDGDFQTKDTNFKDYPHFEIR
tara:strand:- start:1372 stop:1761 length:390 start_codon:yes stop_codon:yes gene_type:complete